MGRLRDAWNGFWFAEGSPLSLAVFRLVFAGCLWGEVAVSRAKNLNAIDDGGFHLPCVGFIVPLSESAYQLLHLAQYPLILLFGIGVLTRLSGTALLAMQGWLLLADALNFRNHPYFFWLVLLLLTLGPASRSLTIPALVRSLRGRSDAEVVHTHPLTFQRLIQVQVCLVYLFAGLHKLHPAYLRGDVLRDLLGPSWPAAASILAAWITVALELSLPVALWIPRIRPAAMIAGALFHIGVAISLDIGVFSSAMIASYVLFLDPDWLRSILRWPGSDEAQRGIP